MKSVKFRGLLRCAASWAGERAGERARVRKSLVSSFVKWRFFSPLRVTISTQGGSACKSRGVVLFCHRGDAQRLQHFSSVASYGCGCSRKVEGSIDLLKSPVDAET